MNVSPVIKNIRNVMRQDKGVNGDAQRLEQMGWMLFLKISDAKDEASEDMDETGDFVSPIPEKFQWRNWAANDKGITGDELIHFIDRELFPGLRELTVANDKRTGLVRDVFRGNNNYMKNGHLFRQVVNEMNKIDFHAAKDRQVFGQVYESILRELQSAGSSGEFYTPRAITEFLTEMVNPRPGEKVLDPACGTGGFLTAAIEHIRKSSADNLKQREMLQNSVCGMELKPLPHLLAVTNLILHDIELPDISYEDALLRNKSVTDKDRAEVILANPPFGGNVDEETADTFPLSFRTRESADLFLVMMVNYLKPGGRAAIVLPDGSLTGNGVKARVREMLLRHCDLHTIVRLPNSVFRPYATVAANLLFFERKSSPAREPDEFSTKAIWFYEHSLPEGMKYYSKTKPIRLSEFDGEREWWNHRTESEKAWKVSIEAIIVRACENAAPHFQKETELKKQARNIKTKITRQKADLKKLDKKKDAVKIKRGQADVDKLEKQLQETETKARAEKKTGDRIYYAAFDLDFKNPNSNRANEEVADINDLLEALGQSFKESSEILQQIKDTIKDCGEL
ncbi:HsdM family class I SAM-dependent methyltransferase [Desulfonema magnum]|uniref:site-specific DNA-methyltransferase (adenine-specific) n=1 Tax=Desulfonema magnum TaxID=45655 RepID=A0A975BJG5_9BACT|nr:class I SAM-dependent DNA methyltransferase [Desulfonema magnum]QTA86483.1 SAM-dependent methyltransferase [Desulfonema magnum]